MVEAGAIPIKIVQRDHNRQQREHSRTMCCPSATWGCGLLLLATVCLTATASVKLVDTDIHEKKVVWLSGMQLEGFNGRQAEYIANSSSYLDSYAVALESALTNAPSLQPVLVIQGHIDDKVVEDLKAVGAIVIRHTLSFRNKLQEYTPELITGLWGSYLRIDIPHIMPKIERLVDAQHVETNYVLWTDPDVIFLQDVNSSVLAKPRYLAIGPDASPDLAENGGVIYFNVSGYSEVFDDLMDWSEQHQFNFRWVDQSMLVGYFNQGGVQRISQLPNVFNWCVVGVMYCGDVLAEQPMYPHTHTHTGNHTGAVPATTSSGTASPTSSLCISTAPNSSLQNVSSNTLNPTKLGDMKPRGGCLTRRTKMRCLPSVGVVASMLPVICCLTYWPMHILWMRGSLLPLPRNMWLHLLTRQLRGVKWSAALVCLEITITKTKLY